MAELADARAELAEARTAIAAPPADAVIHDIADDDPPVPRRFEFAGDQWVMLASFESLAGDAQRRQAWVAEEEAASYATAMARGLMCSDLDSLQRRGPSPARVEQENRELEVAIAARDEAVAAARGRARFVADVAAIQAAVQAEEDAAAVVQAAAEEEARAAAAVQAAAEEEEARATAEAAATKVAFATVTALWDSSLAEALERRRRQDEMSVRRRARRAECKKRSRFDDGAGPSGGQ
jgi:hypothetical protein